MRTRLVALAAALSAALATLVVGAPPAAADDVAENTVSAYGSAPDLGPGSPLDLNTGLIGMNFLCASAEISGGLLPQIGKIVEGIFDMRPYFIEQRLKLRNPIYSETAAYGHMGRKPEIVEKQFVSPDGKTIKRKVELFTWEKLDYVAKIKKAFGLK